MYEVARSRWPKMRPGARLVVWMRPPNPEANEVLHPGNLIRYDDETSSGVPALRLNSIGDSEVLIPHADIVLIQRQPKRA